MLCLWGVIAIPVGNAAPSRTATAGGATVYALSLDGTSMGMLKSVSGATALSPLSAPTAVSAPKVKAAAVKGGGEVTTLELGFGLGGPLYDWIGQAIQGRSAPRKTAIIQYDATFKAVGQRTYDAATISEVAFPTCDAASTAPGFLAVKLQGTPGAETAPPKDAAASSKNAVWTASQFKLAIDGLECRQIIKVEGLTFKRSTTSAVGENKVSLPIIKVTLPEATPESWHKWIEDFMVNGNNQQSDHKSGRLSFLAANGSELAALQLTGIGPQSLDRVDPSSNQAAAKIAVQLYFESATLSVSGK